MCCKLHEYTYSWRYYICICVRSVTLSLHVQRSCHMMRVTHELCFTLWTWQTDCLPANLYSATMSVILIGMSCPRRHVIAPITATATITTQNSVTNRLMTHLFNHYIQAYVMQLNLAAMPITPLNWSCDRTDHRLILLLLLLLLLLLFIADCLHKVS